MAEKATPITREGLERLERELDQLRNVRRPEVAERIHESKELASTQNNAEYELAKNEQAFVEGRIMTLEHIIQNAQLIDQEAAHHSGRVQLGSHVSVKGEEGEKHEYTIVGPAEARPTEGLISNESPVGRALLGKRVGDEFQISVPKGVLRLTVTAIN